MSAEHYHHFRLDCGADFAAVEIPGRRTTAFQIRVLTGMIDEPGERLGVARIVDETLPKGTARRTAQQLSDAFDTLGAQTGSGVGRESFVFRCSCLPEFALDALALHAEMLCTPVFPQEYCDVAVDLARQELRAMEDDPQELAGRMIAPHVFGPRLGRHELGTAETLDRIGRDDIVGFWNSHFSAPRMQITVGGAVDVQQFARRANELFTGFGTAAEPRALPRIEFSPGVHHHHKELEQQHMLIAWPGLRVTHADFPVERVMIGVLGGGMSSRLFTEVREKQGLVYWVGAWDEHPRDGGVNFMGASTTPTRCDQTARTLLREVERLAEDLSDDEVRRVKVGMIAKSKTHGDITRARLGELSADLFHFGRPLTTEEKNAKIEAVTVADVQRYLRDNPRDRRCILTLGPRPLEGMA